MIQAELDALSVDLNAAKTGYAVGVVTVTDSQVDVQPTANAPLIQLKFVSQAAPTMAQGMVDPDNGLPLHFSEDTMVELWIRDAGPAPACWANAYKLWHQRTDTAELGIKLVVLKWIATGITVAGQNYMVEMVGEMKPHPPTAAWTANLCVPLMLRTMFSQ